MPNLEQAYGILLARLDRAGMTIPDAQADYYRQRLEAAARTLDGNGIHLQDTVDDTVLLADYAAWQITNRDKPGEMPAWLRLARRERWLREEAQNDT